jgi:hypothetical protein
VGDEVVEFAGQPSREIRVERIVYLNGEVLRRESWYTHYLAEDKIVRVGTKPRPEPVAPAPRTEPTERDEAPPTTTTAPDGGD